MNDSTVCRVSAVLIVLMIFSPFNFISKEVVARPDASPLIIGVHPYKAAHELRRCFTPLAEYLTSKLGRQVVIGIGKDYEDHITSIGGGSVDLAFIGPVGYVKLVEEYGQVPLLCVLETGGTSDFVGRIIVRDDSPAKSLSDLKGMRFAFVDRLSTMGYLMPMYVLLGEMPGEGVMSEVAFVNSHSNVVLGVLSGDYDAGAIKNEIFLKYRDKGLRVIGSTPEIPEHLFITRKDMPGELLSDIQKAMFSLASTDEGRLALTSINKLATGVGPVTDEEYDMLRAILIFLKKAGIYDE